MGHKPEFGSAGLDINTDAIIEIAVIITDGSLQRRIQVMQLQLQNIRLQPILNMNLLWATDELRRQMCATCLGSYTG